MSENEQGVILSTEKRHLPVKLTDDEMLALAGEWRATMQSEAVVKARHDAKKAEMKEEADAVRGLAMTQAEIARTGHERREVLVLHRLRGAQVETLREDTKEVLDVRPATQAELQRSIPGTEPEGDRVVTDTSTSIAFASGQEDARGGYSAAQNPYPEGSEEAGSWREGWSSVLDAANGNPEDGETDGDD